MKKEKLPDRNLTKENLMALPEGCWIVSNIAGDDGTPIYKGVVGAASARITQWQEICRCHADGKSYRECRDRKQFVLWVKLIEQLRDLYAWPPDKYRAIGLTLQKLQKPDGGNTHYPYKDYTLLDLARVTGILKVKGKGETKTERAPSFLYHCIQLARDIPYKDLVWYRQKGLEWEQVRLMLAALWPGRSSAERKAARIAIRARVAKYGAKGFNDFITKIAPDRRTNNLDARKAGKAQQNK